MTLIVDQIVEILLNFIGDGNVQTSFEIYNQNIVLYFVIKQGSILSFCY